MTETLGKLKSVLVDLEEELLNYKTEIEKLKVENCELQSKVKGTINESDFNKYKLEEHKDLSSIIAAKDKELAELNTKYEKLQKEVQETSKTPGGLAKDSYEEYTPGGPEETPGGSDKASCEECTPDGPEETPEGPQVAELQEKVAKTQTELKTKVAECEETKTKLQEIIMENAVIKEKCNELTEKLSVAENLIKERNMLVDQLHLKLKQEKKRSLPYYTKIVSMCWRERQYSRVCAGYYFRDEGYFDSSEKNINSQLCDR
eukprot:TRINITY_DN5836_c0_g1_i2.p1 TRINITY_DN5836_c0_g1~~TRINITY_DN5836_c0_g1_i2.p1  ORF type:complete len:261 (-),score=48.14 TRINITY_DN5836_c0_g1_i2:1381-2163(-)